MDRVEVIQQGCGVGSSKAAMPTPTATMNPPKQGKRRDVCERKNIESSLITSQSLSLFKTKTLEYKLPGISFVIQPEYNVVQCSVCSAVLTLVCANILS